MSKKSTRIEKVCISEILYNLTTPTEKTSWTILGMTYSTKSSTRCLLEQKILAILIGGSVIPAAVKTPDNKFARIIKPGRNMSAVKTPDKKFAQYLYSF